MKQIIALTFVGLVFLMPIAFAEASAQAQARSISVLDLRLKQIGEAFSDFTFKIKAALTFDNDAKLELLKERNAELKARQQSWVETKQEAMASFNGNMTAKQKQSLLVVLQAEHEAIIEDRLELTEDMREVQAEAKAEGNAELEAEAAAEAESVEKDKSFLGILVDIGINSVLRGSSKSETEVNYKSGSGIRIESEAEAKAVVRKKLGLEGTSVSAVVKGDTAYYVVSGAEKEIESGFSMAKEFKVWVEADTGMIAAVDMNTRIESGSEADGEAEVGSSASGSASSSGSSSAKSKSSVSVRI